MEWSRRGIIGTLENSLKAIFANFDSFINDVNTIVANYFNYLSKSEFIAMLKC